MTKKLYSPNAWIFPLLCWVLSILTALAKIHLGFVNLVLAFGELALLIAAIYIGVVVLLNKEGNYSSKDKNNAIAGLIFVGITFLLIALAIILG